ncbi:N-acetylmannosamine-6-phosphate 2-epimerase [Escherichia coli]|uniref:N-acetylmannosamine-6-phosphate 2-epimerase n=1 Tax=Escherichia coli TaxID=562 RepID=UPI0010AAE3B1|nr:N-acetylmannosamine-6-phosphate 2-epimerase [Escherichia coli]MBZ2263407.1 N-acetylmannosamine-6-phosphate 2-epimerase [Escherichia coli]MBZ2310066.1 N-acetylmannosamine-6-phosphate 2-epimerase [Escherichia coli]MBZ2355766.1 N-acetylmannosamine-6-phosphate 2-epimerase [Escherichia coli]MBZ2369614.1 N-acetylmannosamine-6-phosphate 2-epimerase [Escherichia coli]MBZ2383518.1 N-acetylmannosamine-6-phosphate 2-epimerase [Escherichia coli]
MKTVLDSLKGKLIVSCQALENEPLHSPFIMSRMALAAAQGGAAGIRANSVVDIRSIKESVSLPVIGIIKRDCPGCEVFITATLQEVDELMTVEPEIIALDATARPRPGGQMLEELVMQIRVRYPSVLLMADIATVDEAVTAERLGFDCVGTTLYGYTADTAGHVMVDNDCGFLREVLAAVTIPVVAEGNIDTPERAARCLALGAHTVVVGGAITRPQQITARFVAAIAS